MIDCVRYYKGASFTKTSTPDPEDSPRGPSWPGRPKPLFGTLHIIENVDGTLTRGLEKLPDGAFEAATTNMGEFLEQFHNGTRKREFAIFVGVKKKGW